MTKVNIPSILVSPDSPTPKSTKSFYSLFSLKTPSIKSPLKSPQKSPIKSFKSTTNSSKNEIRYVLNGAKRVLTKFQHFNHHHELCVKCTGFIEQVIKILEEVGTLSENNRDQLIETKEYNDCSTLIFEIEYYFKKLDQVNSNQFVVKETLKKFVLNLEIVVNAIQRASEHLKPKKVSKWSPSIVSKIKTIGKLMVMKKESDRIKDDSDFAPLMHEEEPVIQQGLNIPTSEVEDPSNIPTSVEDPLNVPTSVEDPIEVPVIVEDPLKVPTSEKEDPIEPIIQREVIFTESLIREDESPNEPIIQQDIIMPTGFIKQELIISTGLNRGGNNEGMFFNNKVSEKCIGIIPRDDIKFTKFQNEMSYLMKLSCGCNNILSVKGFTERSIMDNPSILIYIVNYLISSLFLKLTYRNKYATMLVTEWAEFNLPDYLEKNDLDWSAKLSIARGIANALNHIHNLNLLHYNVKSDSVLLDHNLEPKLHKFGMDAKDCVFLKSARSLKSSNWSAPEVKRGGKYTSASEVYSFGVILWEIATQECLSGNKSIDKRDIDDAPTNYLTLMKSALDQEPQNRPTMQEMFDSLSQLESFYSARQQKQQNLSIRNIINILHTNSVVSSSSEDHLTIDSASSSRVTSRANSPAPSISDHEYMFFTNNVNTTSKVENSTDNDEFTVSESTSSIEKSSTVNVNDTSNLEKSSIFTNHVVESPISTKNVDCNSDNENSSTFTLTNDVDYHSGTEISTSTNDVDYHSDTESSTIFTKDVEINAENSLTSTNDVDYHSDTESSTIFIKDVETNAEKSTTFTNDVDYHSDTENSTTITNNVETNAENSPTFTNNVDHNSNIEILQTLTNDIKSTSNIEKSSSTIIHHVESASNAENSPTFTNNIKSTSDTKILTNDVNSASNIETIDLNEFQKLHNNKQYRKAFRLINGYAKQDPKVLFWMGYYHYKGYHESSPYKPDIMTGFKYLEEGAKLNDPDALYYSSYILFNCCLNGIENRYEIALKHLKKASEQNHPASMLELGKYMINGKFGCKKDVTSGKTLIRRSKELGNRSAKFNQKVDDRKYRSASNASTSPLKRNVYQKKSRTSSNASSASSIRPMIVSKSFSSKKTNTITMDQFRHSAYV